MGLDQKPTAKYWFYSIDKKWHQRELPIIVSFNHIEDTLETLDYLKLPDLVVGDEFSFASMFEHPFKDEYLFHFEIDSFAKLLFADSLPASFFVLEQLNYLLNAHFRTIKLLDELNEV